MNRTIFGVFCLFVGVAGFSAAAEVPESIQRYQLHSLAITNSTGVIEYRIYRLDTVTGKAERLTTVNLWRMVDGSPTLVAYELWSPITEYSGSDWQILLSDSNRINPNNKNK
jgi:hypothetical protein